MADYGRALISKIVYDDDITTAMASGIRSSWFEDKDYATIYRWMVEYFNRYSEVPTEVALKTEYPTFRMAAVLEPYAYYVDKFRDMHKRAILVDAIADANDALIEGDLKRSQEEMSKGILRIGKEISILVDMNAIGRSERKTRYEKYEDARDHAGEMTGIPTGFPILNGLTGGYHPQQFILLGGSAKQGKSFMMMNSAIAAQENGKKVLFVSFEMSVFEQLVRYDALCCGVSASRLLRGVLEEDEMKRLKSRMTKRRDMAPFIVSADTSATTTVSGLAGKIEEHQPDIVFVDGVYLMENEVGAPEGSPQAYTSISRGLKRLAQRTDQPLIASTQALTAKMGKGMEVTMHSLGWTSAWAQDADLIIGVERPPDSTNLIKLRVAGGRNVSPMEWGVMFDWERSILEEIDPDDTYDDQE